MGSVSLIASPSVAYGLQTYTEWYNNRIGVYVSEVGVADVFLRTRASIAIAHTSCDNFVLLSSVCPSQPGTVWGPG